MSARADDQPARPRPAAPERHAHPGSAAEGRVPRDRLLHTLLADSIRPVVVISAAAGSGKSTLAAQWAERDSRPHAVVALARYMDDPAVLATQIVDALECFGAPAPRTRAAITGTEPAFSAVLLPALNELTGSRTKPFVLVLDDAHVLRSAQSHDVLAAVCQGLPTGSTLALLTRDAAPACLARARAEGRVTEVRDLSFDADEAERLFTDMALPLDGSEVLQLLAQSEGWAVGLYLAGLARRDGVSTTSGEFRRFVGDYLQTQVLDTLAPAQRHFLLQTSGLDELTPALCDAVTGRSDSGAMLADLARRLQLVVETGVDPSRYRYHHLLADSLHSTLVATEPEAPPVLHARAARWYADNGELDSAVRHARASGDMRLTGELVWSGVVPCVGSGRPDRLRGWLAELTEQQLAMDPWLTLTAAWLALQEGDGARMRRWALTAEKQAGRDWRSRVSTEPYAASVATLVVLIGQPLQDVVTMGAEAARGLPVDSGFRPAMCWLRGVAQTLLGQLDEGRASMIEAELLATALDVPVIHADSHAFLGVLDVLGGERERGLDHIQQAAALIREHDLDRLATAAHTVTAQAFALAAVGDRKAAEVALADARRLSSLTDSIAPWFGVLGRVIQARTALLLGDAATARVLIQEAGRELTPDLQGTLLEQLLEDTRATLQSSAASGAGAVALTSAEMRILQFLPSHLSFPQIGERLFLSQNTIKTHALAIYRKFGVSSRSDAVAKAQQLGLVEPPARD